MAKNINDDIFSEETKLKLDIFRECFREWFPVFVHNPYIKRVFIYDFFAGSGTDKEGTYGSPLILLDEAKGGKKQHCEHFHANPQKIVFAFNEFLQDKKKQLEGNVSRHFLKCKSKCESEYCVYDDCCFFESKDFKELFQSQKIHDILNDKSCGKFILLDQYGYKNVTDEVFLKLVNSPKTDFIFFIASFFINRFKNQPAVTTYFQRNSINFDPLKPQECHRRIAEYYRNLVPKDKEYYVHHFSIQKGTGYNGLIFGSNHSFGMEKFLKVCWSHDTSAGESSHNVNGDFGFGELFHDPQNTSKLVEVKTKLKSEILNGNIRTNIAGLKFALKNGCQPKVYIDVIQDLVTSKQVEPVPNKQATNIHNIKEYDIKLINQ